MITLSPGEVKQVSVTLVPLEPVTISWYGFKAGYANPAGQRWGPYAIPPAVSCPLGYLGAGVCYVVVNIAAEITVEICLIDPDGLERGCVEITQVTTPDAYAPYIQSWVSLDKVGLWHLWTKAYRKAGASNVIEATTPAIQCE